MGGVSIGLDGADLRRTFGMFATGVTVITTVDADGVPHGLTVNSFSSVSLDPPLILWSQSTSAPSHAVFKDAEKFAVNILAEEQVSISQQFARGAADKFSQVMTHRGEGDVPLIDGCCAHIECVTEQVMPGGDHTIFLGRVHRVAREDKPPLVFSGGRYMMLQQHDALWPAGLTSGRERLNAKIIPMASTLLATLSKTMKQALALAVWGSEGPTVIRWFSPADFPLGASLQPGWVLPLTSSATGIAFLAWLSEEKTAEALERERRLLSNEAYASLPGILSAARATGAASVDASEDFIDVYGTKISAIAVPVFGGDGEMLCSFSAVGAPGSSLAEWRPSAMEQLQEASRTLSARLLASKD